MLHEVSMTSLYGISDHSNCYHFPPICSLGSATLPGQCQKFSAMKRCLAQTNLRVEPEELHLIDFVPAHLLLQSHLNEDTPQASYKHCFNLLINLLCDQT